MCHSFALQGKGHSRLDNTPGSGSQHNVIGLLHSFCSTILGDMRIGFDGKRAVFNNTGLGNYSRTLLGSLSEFYPGNQYRLYTPKYVSSPRVRFAESRENLSIVTPDSLLGRALGPLWRSRLINRQLKKDQLDIFHGLSNELPFGIETTGIKTVVTIHDMIFKRYPQLYPRIDRIGYDRKVAAACRIADVIVAVSEQTRQDIVEFEGVDPEKIRVIYQSCDEQFVSAPAVARLAEVKRKHNLPDSYLLYVGSIEERKNLLSAVKAIESFTDLNLIVLGNGGSYRRRVEDYIIDHKLESRVRILSDVAFADFPAIYRQALALIYPSIFEGFGIPIIEALWSRLPVITTKGGVFPEAGGPGSIYVDPYDVAALRSAIERLINDEQRRVEMADTGFEYVQRFSREYVTKQMMTLYEGLVGL